MEPPATVAVARSWGADFYESLGGVGPSLWTVILPRKAGRFSLSLFFQASERASALDRSDDLELFWFGLLQKELE